MGYIAIAPVIGGSLLSADSPMTTEYTEIEDKQVSRGAAGSAGELVVREAHV